MGEFSIKGSSSSSSSDFLNYMSPDSDIERVSTIVNRGSGNEENSNNSNSTNTNSKNDNSINDNSYCNNLNNDDDFSYGTFYLKQFSFDPGLSSSESDSDYERLEEAKKRNKLELHLKKLFHEKSFKDIIVPNWKGMKVKKWKPYKIHIRFYVRELADSNLIDDNKYNVSLKTNHKLRWYVNKSSIPPETNIRKPFINEVEVTNNNLKNTLECVYDNVKRFASKCSAINTYDYSSEED